MAVRILDPNPQPEALKEATCMSCGARLEYTKGDVQDFRREHYGGDSTIGTYVVCPKCGERVVLTSY